MGSHMILTPKTTTLDWVIQIWPLEQTWYSWVQSGGPVTTESIVRFDTWFELFEVLRKKNSPHDPRENGGGICEKRKSKMATGGHIGNVTWKQIDIETCVIPLFLLILAWKIHFWHRFLYFDQFNYQNSRYNTLFKLNANIYLAC